MFCWLTGTAIVVVRMKFAKYTYVFDYSKFFIRVLFLGCTYEKQKVDLATKTTNAKSSMRDSFCLLRKQNDIAEGKNKTKRGQ